MAPLFCSGIFFLLQNYYIVLCIMFWFQLLDFVYIQITTTPCRKQDSLQFYRSYCFSFLFLHLYLYLLNVVESVALLLFKTTYTKYNLEYLFGYNLRYFGRRVEKKHCQNLLAYPNDYITINLKMDLVVFSNYKL